MQLLGLVLGGLLPLGSVAAPVSRSRRRLRFASAAALLVGLGFGGSTPALPASGAVVAPRCGAASTGWCVSRRFAGSDRNGELGFRFGEPLDGDGDGKADVAAGARFKLWHGTQQNGTATVWSGRDGAVIRAWDGEAPDGLFGHWVLPIPDVSGDGLADLVIAAPHARVGAIARGTVEARSPKTGAQIWRREETVGENLGWDMALAGDENGDGLVDVFVGAPGADGGRVDLLSGKDGSTLRTYDAPNHDEAEGFGWYVARVDDLDGDGRRDLLVGAPSAPDREAHGARVGGAWLFSTATGRELRRWRGTDPRGGFGGVVAGMGDLDGDGRGEIVIATPGTEDPSRTLVGEVAVYSGRTGVKLRTWVGTQPGELYGRMIVSAGDVDGDGIDDLAIGAPWHRTAAGDRVGRLELRSGRTGKLVAEFSGDGPDCWFGWHVRRAPDPDGGTRPALLVGTLRHPVDGAAAVGVLDLYVRRDGAHHGMKTRGARRSDIK